MDLPPELRNNIYNHYFEDIKVVDRTKQRRLFPRVLNEEQISTSIPRTAFSISALRPYLSLLHSSTIVRSEAAPIFYKSHIGSPDLALVVRCDLRTTNTCRKVPSRAQGFCSSVAIYNINAKLLIWSDTHSSLEFLCIRMLQAILNQMLAAGGSAFRRQVSFNWCAMDRTAYPGAMDKMLHILPEMAEFEVGHALKSHSDQKTLTSLFVQGPLAKLDLCDLELRFKSVHDEWVKGER